jgi:HNH endonuclease
MTESTNRDDEWLAQIEKSVEVKVEHLWKIERWSEFVKEVVWLLHIDEERDDADTIEAAVGLIVYGIRKKQDLIRVAGNPPNSEAFNRKLEATGVRPAICDILFDKYIAQRRSSTGVETIPGHMVPVLLRLAVNSMKSGWEKISSERTKSESSTARDSSVSYYGLHSRETFQILGSNTAHVQNAHIWPYNNREAMILVDLLPPDIDDPRNVLRLHEDIEYYLDRFQLTLICPEVTLSSKY